MEILVQISGICGSVITIITLVTLLFRPARQCILKFINGRKEAEEAEKLSEQEEMETKERLNRIEELMQTLADNQESLSKVLSVHNTEQKAESEKLRLSQQCMIRSSITHMYYKYKEAQCLPVHEKENLVALKTSYDQLDGNSYVHSIYEEMMEWDTVIK